MRGDPSPREKKAPSNAAHYSRQLSKRYSILRAASDQEGLGQLRLRRQRTRKRISYWYQHKSIELVIASGREGLFGGRMEYPVLATIVPWTVWLV